jgi:hippurate hydrolase
MRNILLLLTVLLLPFQWASAQGYPKKMDTFIESDVQYLNALYLYLHQHPELSLQEKNTASMMAKELRGAGFSVTENFGGYGIVGILKNGDGPTVLVRTDMDALPITEKTDVPYASTVKAIDDRGNEVGVMHACGHDIHMSVWVGTARVLNRFRDKWHGTLIFIGQPAEEKGKGADMMLKAGLFTKFPYPDFNLALHDSPVLKAGTVGIHSGWAMANVDMLDIDVYGVGGHGALPQYTIDPIVIAAKIIVDLQTIVSREISPFSPAVVTVGKISGGTVGNVIPEHVNLQLTVRTFEDDVREHVLNSIKTTCKGIAISAGVPDSLLPKVTVHLPYTPALYNNPELSGNIYKTFQKVLGNESVFEIGGRTTGEDFSRYGRTNPPIPSLMFRLGAVSPENYEKAQKGEIKLPSVHSPYFLPDYEPTIMTGVKAMSSAVMELMN